MALPMHVTLMVYPSDAESEIEVADADLPSTVIRLAVKLLRAVKRQSAFCAYTECLPLHCPNPTLVFKHVAENDIYRTELMEIVKYGAKVDCSQQRSALEVL